MVSAMRKCVLLIALVVIPIVVAVIADAQQQAKKIPRIGILRTGSAPDPFVEAFRQGLRDLGYVEGKSVVIEYRWAEGRTDRLPDLAADLVRLGVDVIVPGGNIATRAVQKATSTIPVVMSGTTDPVADGFVVSLARPGGNITGSATLLQDVGTKRLEFLIEVVRKVSRVGFLYGPGNSPVEIREAQEAAQTLGVQLKLLEVRAQRFRERVQGSESWAHRSDEHHRVRVFLCASNPHRQPCR